jgi:protein-L-isoaspartate(D-aspartate) O-methyltransferase
LDSLGLLNINMRIEDGTAGWEAEAPFDAIIVSAGAPYVPKHLIDQLCIGGRLVIPVGNQSEQVLARLTKGADCSVTRENFVNCRFVRLIGQFAWNSDNI